MKLLHKGKVKEVYELDDKRLLFRFTDQISVFDKIIPTLVPKKGESLNRTSEYWLRECERLGIRTHFLERPSSNEMIVKRVQVIHDRARLTPETKNFFIPLEVICRHFLAGSMHDRVKRGDVAPETLGLPAGEVPPYGARLPQPFVEFTTKLEPVDRELTEAEAFAISGLTEAEFAELKETVVRIDARIQERADAVGLVHVDGKKEFAMDDQRRLMVVDTFGTLDEDRWWDKAALAEGRHVELSKEMVRQHYRETGYHAALYAARKAGGTEPSIPALPDSVTAQVTDLYVGLCERLTGEKW